MRHKFGLKLIQFVSLAGGRLWAAARRQSKDKHGEVGGGSRLEGRGGGVPFRDDRMTLGFSQFSSTRTRTSSNHDSNHVDGSRWTPWINGFVMTRIPFKFLNNTESLALALVGVYYSKHLLCLLKQTLSNWKCISLGQSVWILYILLFGSKP